MAPFIEGADAALAHPSVEVGGDPARLLGTTPPELTLIASEWLPEGGQRTSVQQLAGRPAQHLVFFHAEEGGHSPVGQHHIAVLVDYEHGVA